MEKNQCTKCRQPLSLECFRINKQTARLTAKYYLKCLDNCKKSIQQAKCKHRRQRSQFKDSYGSQICEHNKRRSRCKDTGESQIYEHNKQRLYLKDCGGS